MNIAAVYVQRKRDGYTVARWEQTWLAPSESKHLAWRVANYFDPRNVHEPATSRLETLMAEQGFAEYGLEHLGAVGANISAWSSGGYYQLSNRRLAGSYPTYWLDPFELAVSENLGLTGVDAETGKPVVSALRVCVLWERADGLSDTLAAYDLLHRVSALVRRYDRLFQSDVLTGTDASDLSESDEELTASELGQRCRLNLLLQYCMQGVDMADVEKWVQNAPLCREYDGKAMNAWRSLWERKEQLRERALATGILSAAELIAIESAKATEALNSSQTPAVASKPSEATQKKKHSRGKRHKRDKGSKHAKEASPAATSSPKEQTDPLQTIIFTRTAYTDATFMQKTRQAIAETLFGTSHVPENEWMEDFAYAKALDVPPVEATIDDWLAMLDAKAAEERATAEAAAAIKRVNLWLVDDEFLDQNPGLAAELFERAPYFDGERLLQRAYDESFSERAYAYFQNVFYLLERGHFKDALAILQDNIMAGMVRQRVLRTNRVPRAPAPDSAKTETEAANTSAQQRSQFETAAGHSAPREDVLTSAAGASTAERMDAPRQDAEQAIHFATIPRGGQTQPLIEEVDDAPESAPKREALTASESMQLTSTAIIEVLPDEQTDAGSAPERQTTAQALPDVAGAASSESHARTTGTATEKPHSEPDSNTWEQSGTETGVKAGSASEQEFGSDDQSGRQAEAPKPGARLETTEEAVHPQVSGLGEESQDSLLSAGEHRVAHELVKNVIDAALGDAVDNVYSENATLSAVPMRSGLNEAPTAASATVDTALGCRRSRSTPDGVQAASDEGSITETTPREGDTVIVPALESQTERISLTRDESSALDNAATAGAVSILGDRESLQEQQLERMPLQTMATTAYQTGAVDGNAANGALAIADSSAQQRTGSESSLPPESEGPDPSPDHKRLYLLGCWYKLALHILERITSLDRIATEQRTRSRQGANVRMSPEDERAQAHLSNLLAYLPLLPRHRQAAVNVSIEKNMQLGNYGYARGWIDWAYDRFPFANSEATRARYDRILDECEDAAWQNEYVVPELDRLMEYYGRGALKLREYLLLAQEEVSGLWNLPSEQHSSGSESSSSSSGTESANESSIEDASSVEEDLEGIVLSDTSSDA